MAAAGWRQAGWAGWLAAPPLASQGRSLAARRWQAQLPPQGSPGTLQLRRRRCRCGRWRTACSGCCPPRGQGDQRKENPEIGFVRGSGWGV